MNFEKKIKNLARFFRVGGKAGNGCTQGRIESGINISEKISALGLLVIFFSVSGSLYAQDDQSTASNFHNSEVERIFELDDQHRNSITMVEWEGQVYDSSPIILAHEDKIQIQEFKPEIGSSKSEYFSFLSVFVRNISIPVHRVEIPNSCTGRPGLYVIEVGQFLGTMANSPNFSNSSAMLNAEFDPKLSYSFIAKNLEIGRDTHSIYNFSGIFTEVYFGQYKADQNLISISYTDNQQNASVIWADRASKYGYDNNLRSSLELSSLGLIPNRIITNSNSAILLDYKTFQAGRNSKLGYRQLKAVNNLSPILSDTFRNSSTRIRLLNRPYQEQNNIEKIVVFENISVWLPNPKESLSISSSLPCEDYQWKLMTTKSANV